MRTPLRFAAFLAGLALVTVGSPAGAAAAEPERASAPAPRPTTLDERIWRIHDGIERWERRCSALGAGRPVRADVLHRDAERLVASIRGLRSRVARLDAAQRPAAARKLAVLRARASAAASLVRAPNADTCSSRRRSTNEAPRPTRTTVEAGGSCETATAIGLDEVQAPLSTTRRRGPSGLVAQDLWFRVDATASGTVEAHTRGSRADTALAVFDRCEADATPVARDDDALGLASAISFPVHAGERRWIRVRQRVGREHDDLLLTVRGSVTGLSGVVTEKASGDPIDDVEVEVYESDGSYVTSADTDANGIFAITGLDPGTYFAVTDQDRRPYLDELWDDRPCPRGCDETTGDPIVVNTGEVTTGVDFALQRAGTIAGRVRDSESGELLRGVDVTRRLGEPVRR